MTLVPNNIPQVNSPLISWDVILLIDTSIKLISLLSCEIVPVLVIVYDDIVTLCKLIEIVSFEIDLLLIVLPWVVNKLEILFFLLDLIAVNVQWSEWIGPCHFRVWVSIIVVKAHIPSHIDLLNTYLRLFNHISVHPANRSITVGTDIILI